MVISAIVFSACGDDDSTKVAPEEVKLSINDPDAVSQAMSVSGATLKEGMPPSPTSDAASPILNDEGGDEKGIAIAGNGRTIYVNETSGVSIAGIYLQIQGASSYFDIPVSSTSVEGGRVGFGRRARTKKTKTMNSWYGFNLEIPANLEAGEFCVSYCVYTTDGLVSNVAQVCIIVKEFGGDDSEFLTANAWELVSSTYYELYDGQVDTDTTIVGQLNSNTYDYQVTCGDSSAVVSITETDRLNYLYIAMSSNGAFTAEDEYYEKSLDHGNSNCQSIKYDETTLVYTIDGAWSYDAATGEMILIYNGEETDDQGNTYIETDVEITKVSLVDGNLIWIFQEGEEGSDYYYKDIMTFKPKQ